MPLPFRDLCEALGVPSPSRVFAFELDDLLKPSDTATCALPPLEVLRNVFGDYNKLRPDFTAVRVTRAAAPTSSASPSNSNSNAPSTPNARPKNEIAHFLMRLVFCLFADSVGLLPNHTFRRLVKNDRLSPINFNRKLPVLFQAMSKANSFFGADNIPYFNGGLFSDDRTIELNHADLGILYSASQHDWSHIEPAIFGTLFERSLDAGQTLHDRRPLHLPRRHPSPHRAGRHAPLRRRWELVKQSVLDALRRRSPPAESASTNFRALAAKR